jgi:L-iditol 2-dehydrogenase
MKAAFIRGKGIVELKDVSTPRIGPMEILVRMRVCGICGTDLEKVHGEHITPPVLGHEVAGEVEQVGEKVQGVDRGGRVIIHHHISCYSCFYCKNGLETLCEAFPASNFEPCGFAECFRVPETLVRGGTVYNLPDSMSYEEGSQVEPTACCIRALRKAQIKPGSSVAVFGVGPAGLTHVQLLKSYGASQIFAIDVIEHRRELAAKFGATRTFDPLKENIAEALASHTDCRGVDVAIVATGNPRAIEQAADSVRKGGQVVLFGAPARGTLLSLDVSRFFLRELSFQSSYSTSETEMRIALDLISSKRIQPSEMITHRLPLEEVVEAFRLAESGKEAAKVVVHNL